MKKMSKYLIYLAFLVLAMVQCITAKADAIANDGMLVDLAADALGGLSRNTRCASCEAEEPVPTVCTCDCCKCEGLMFFNEIIHNYSFVGNDC